MAPLCQRRATDQRARRLATLLGTLGRKVAWGVWVLTVPPAMAPPSRQAFIDLRRAAVKTVNGWARRWLWAPAANGQPLEIGGAVVPHPVGRAGNRFQLHFNILVPLAGVPARVGRPVLGRTGVSTEAKEDLRQRWRKELQRLGWDSDQQTPIAWFGVETRPKQRPFILRYFCRVFPEWTAPVQQISYFGLLAKGEFHEGYGRLGIWRMPSRLPGKCPCGCDTHYALSASSKMHAAECHIIESLDYLPGPFPERNPPIDELVAQARSVPRKKTPVPTGARSVPRRPPRKPGTPRGRRGRTPGRRALRAKPNKPQVILVAVVSCGRRGQTLEITLTGTGKEARVGISRWQMKGEHSRVMKPSTRGSVAFFLVRVPAVAAALGRAAAGADVSRVWCPRYVRDGVEGTLVEDGNLEGVVIALFPDRHGRACIGLQGVDAGEPREGTTTSVEMTTGVAALVAAELMRVAAQQVQPLSREVTDMLSGGQEGEPPCESGNQESEQ